MADIVKPELNDEDEQEIIDPAPTPEAAITSIADRIAEMELALFGHAAKVAIEMSKSAHGHEAGNVTSQDLSYKFKSYGIKPALASELAREAIRKHEEFRWSEEGMAIQAEAAKPKTEPETDEK